jgi:hypothetical protein
MQGLVRNRDRSGLMRLNRTADQGCVQWIKRGEIDFDRYEEWCTKYIFLILTTLKGTY